VPYDDLLDDLVVYSIFVNSFTLNNKKEGKRQAKFYPKYGGLGSGKRGLR
jgi:hypothetical protein